MSTTTRANGTELTPKAANSVKPVTAMKALTM